MSRKGETFITLPTIRFIHLSERSHIHSPPHLPSPSAAAAAVPTPSFTGDEPHQAGEAAAMALADSRQPQRVRSRPCPRRAGPLDLERSGSHGQTRPDRRGSSPPSRPTARPPPSPSLCCVGLTVVGPCAPDREERGLTTPCSSDARHGLDLEGFFLSSPATSRYFLPSPAQISISIFIFTCPHSPQISISIFIFWIEKLYKDKGLCVV